LLALCAALAVTLVTASMFLGGHTAMWTILAVGLFNSIMFPTIFSLGVAELGPLTGNGSGLLNMAIVGGAILPVIQGVIADQVGLHHAFILPVLCYLYILYYGLSGSKTDLAIFSNEAGPHAPLAQAKVHSADYPSLQAIVKEFLAKSQKPVDRACFAVAGPVIGGRVKTTNLPWVIEENSLARELNLNL